MSFLNSVGAAVIKSILHTNANTHIHRLQVVQGHSSTLRKQQQAQQRKSTHTTLLGMERG